MDTKQQSDREKETALPERKSHYQKLYSEKGLWHKIKNTARAAGEKTIYQVLVLFYTMREPSTPVWCKGVILGTLGYFISLIDAIPDLTPIIGYTDDITLIVAAIGTLAAYITPEIEAKAKAKTQEYFKNENENEVNVNSEEK
ncbi:MAG: DUF1232 domain-containing protein [Hahellaceae bacterium]|nr:DUF1232 domain-containing protein [Hahellaceae bacterium]MCP5211243.1 DUF1232 domain-containing protein [Hahellaceae bacterium]